MKRTIKKIEQEIWECYADLEFSEGEEKKKIQDNLDKLGKELKKRLPKLTSEQIRKKGVKLQLNAIFGL